MGSLRGLERQSSLPSETGHPVQAPASLQDPQGMDECPGGKSHWEIREDAWSTWGHWKT